MAAYSELLPILLMNPVDPEGWGGELHVMRRFGDRTDVIGPTNDASAPLAAMYAAASFAPLPEANWPAPAVRNYYNAWVGELDVTPYVGKPTAPDQPAFTATATGISFDLQGIDYSREATHFADLYYSHDRLQRKVIQDVAKTGTVNISLPTNTAIWPIIAVRDAQGTSPLYQRQNEVHSPTGRRTNAGPAFDDAPLIHYRSNPEWKGIDGRPAGPDQYADEPEFLCGAGILSSGHPAPVYASDGSGDWRFYPIWNGVERAQSYSFEPPYDTEAGTLQWRVTVANSEGMAEAYSNEIRVPGIAALPAGTLIDTDFRRIAKRRLGAIYENIVVRNGQPFRLSDATTEGFDSPGYLTCQKGSTQSEALSIPLGELAVTGTSYLVNAQVRLLSSGVNRVRIGGAGRVDIPADDPAVSIGSDTNVMTITDFIYTVPSSENGSNLVFEQILAETSSTAEIRMGRLKVERLS